MNLSSIEARINQYKTYNYEIEKSRYWSLVDRILGSFGLTLRYDNQTISTLEERRQQLAATCIQRNWRKVRFHIEKILQAAQILKKRINYTHSIIIIQRTWRRKRMTPLERREDRFLKAISIRLTHSDLIYFYKPTDKFLGSGCHGKVREGIDRTNGQIVAIKIGHDYCFYPHREDNLDHFAKILARIDYALDATPHLTRVNTLRRALSSCTRSSKYSYTQTSPKVYWEEWKKVGKTRIITVMERLEGDAGQKFDQVIKPALVFQRIHTIWILKYMFGLQVRDVKTANILYKQLMPEDTFQGKKMIDYDYWKYSMQSHEYYIPRQDILIKFGDYDMWEILSDLPNQSTKQPPDFLQDLIDDLSPYWVEKDVSAETIRELFQKPKEPNARILTIN